MLFLKLATLWHDCVILFTFYFWTGYMGVTEPSHMWRCTHLYVMCIHIPICQSNWKLHACDRTHVYQHRTWLENFMCEKHMYLLTCDHFWKLHIFTYQYMTTPRIFVHVTNIYQHLITLKNCMYLYMCAHILRMNMLRSSMCLNMCEHDNMWPCFETACVWICECMQKYMSILGNFMW